MLDIKQAEKDLSNLASDVIQRAKAKGATATELDMQKGEGMSTNVRMGDIETLEYNRDQSLSLTVYFGQRKGSATTADLSEKAIEDCLNAACRIAKYTSEDKYSGLADADLMAEDMPDLDLYHPWEIEPENAAEIALKCESAALSSDNKVDNSNGATLSSYSGLSLYSNSHGFIGFHPGSQHSISCSVIAKENDIMEGDGWYDVSRLGSRLESPESIGKTAATRALKRLDARKLATQNAPILYDARMANSLLGHFTSAISGPSQYKEASFLLNAKGEKIFPEFIQLHEQPYIKQGLGSRAYDNEGVATREQYLVKNGIVQDYLLGSYSARKLATNTTANAGGTHNLTLNSTGQSFDELLKALNTGFYVTELMGSSVNIVTGDYSRGAAGFWVENGEIQHSVKEVTIAGNLKDMYQKIVAIGNDINTRSATRTGSVLIEDMVIAGE